MDNWKIGVLQNCVRRECYILMLFRMILWIIRKKRLENYFQEINYYLWKFLNSQLLVDKVYVLYSKLVDNLLGVSTYIRYKNFYDIYVKFQMNNYDMNEIKVYLVRF